MSSSHQGSYGAGTYPGEVNLANWRGPIAAVAIETALSLDLPQLQEQFRRYYTDEWREYMLGSMRSDYRSSEHPEGASGDENAAERLKNWEALVLAGTIGLFEITGCMPIEDVVSVTGIGQMALPSKKTRRSFQQTINGDSRGRQWREYTKSVDDKLEAKARFIDANPEHATSEAEQVAALAVRVFSRPYNKNLSAVYQELEEVGGEGFEAIAVAEALETLLNRHHGSAASAWSSDHKAEWREFTAGQLAETRKILEWTLDDILHGVGDDVGNWDPRPSEGRLFRRKAETLLRWSKVVLRTYWREQDEEESRGADPVDMAENEGDVTGGEDVLETFDFERFNAEERGNFDSWMSG